MRKLNFDIYIGKNMVHGQGKDVVAVVTLPTNIPKGQCEVDGLNVPSIQRGFFLLNVLGNYMQDWLDFIGDEESITATIYLHKISQHKKFTGSQIVKVIDAMTRANNYCGVDVFEKIRVI